MLLSDFDDFHIEEAHDENRNVEDKDEDEGHVQFTRRHTMKIVCDDSARWTTTVPFHVGHTPENRRVYPNHNNDNPDTSFGEQSSVGEVETIVKDHVPVDRKREKIGDGGYEENVVHSNVHTTKLNTPTEVQVVGENVHFQWDDEKCH